MVLKIFFRICFSEEEESMDVDSEALPKSKTDDLAEYNLDDYDNDVKDDGALLSLFFLYFHAHKIYY